MPNFPNSITEKNGCYIIIVEGHKTSFRTTEFSKETAENIFNEMIAIYCHGIEKGKTN